MGMYLFHLLLRPMCHRNSEINLWDTAKPLLAYRGISAGALAAADRSLYGD